MTEKKWSSASLRITSRTMSAVEITKTLGANPTDYYEKGTPVSRRHPGSPLRLESVWILESGLDGSEPLETHIAKLTLLVEEKVDLLKELISICNIEIFCGFGSESGQGGFVIEAALLKRLAVIPIDIVFDLYPLAIAS